MLRLTVVAAAISALAAAPAGAATVSISSGPAKLTFADAPWSLTVAQRGGQSLVSRDGIATTARGDVHRVVGVTRLVATPEQAAATVTLDDGTEADVVARPDASGAFTVSVSVASIYSAVGLPFATSSSERLFGTGERSDAVDRFGRETENYVSDGPYPPGDRLFIKPTTPPWALRDRDDSTYFPLPWVLTSNGWGVLAEGSATSRLLSGARRWTLAADGTALTLRIFSGPTPAAALGRFTRSVGRQRAPSAPWAFGPWFQTGQPNVVPLDEELSIARTQRQAGAPVSVVETQMHFLPCGAQQGREQAELARSEAFHRLGLARLVYFNPLICLSYSSAFQRAVSAGGLQRTSSGDPYTYPAYVGGEGPAGFTEEPLAQFDFTAPGAEGFYRGLVAQAVGLGADGWMEDFGESTPPLITQHDGTRGDEAHNRYPTDYHCALSRIARTFGRPLVRFQRSGWTGSAACADVVWGGDPTTRWGFDGLSSAVTELLSIGLSGVARWGTDIGGYDSFGDDRLTPEMLTRWMELGALVPVMRTKRTGLAIPSYDRPQVFDAAHLRIWRRLTELHMQLNDYLREADAEYRRTGMPIARHLALVYPGDARAERTDDEYMLGDDLLVAPVVQPGARERVVYLPRGDWTLWWTGRVYSGPGEVTVPAPQDQIPVFVRGGATSPLPDPASFDA